MRTVTEVYLPQYQELSYMPLSYLRRVELEQIASPRRSMEGREGTAYRYLADSVVTGSPTNPRGVVTPRPRGWSRARSFFWHLVFALLLFAFSADAVWTFHRLIELTE